MEPKHGDPSTTDEETGLSTGTFSKADIERLGRQRPDVFHNAFAEIGFCFSLLASMFMAVSVFSLRYEATADSQFRNTSSAASD